MFPTKRVVHPYGVSACRDGAGAGARHARALDQETDMGTETRLGVQRMKQPPCLLCSLLTRTGVEQLWARNRAVTCILVNIKRAVRGNELHWPGTYSNNNT